MLRALAVAPWGTRMKRPDPHQGHPQEQKRTLVPESRAVLPGVPKAAIPPSTVPALSSGSIRFYHALVSLPRIVLTAYPFAFFGVIGLVTVRVRLRIGYSPVIVFRSGNGMMIAKVLALWSVPPVSAAASWFPEFPPFRPFESLSRSGLEIAGTVLLGLSIVWFLLSCLSLGDSWRIGIDPGLQGKLVTKGIYARFRHPIYTGFLVMFFSVFLIRPCPVTGLIGSIGIPALIAHAFGEERFLLNHFGEEYARYRKRTWMLLPWL